jgi:membrane protein insertase Oxa1/YidC/SpoIIIJ
VGEWIGPIEIPLMALLRWVHAWVGNYGWSIVVLTVLINVIMAPLRHYSIANGIKMAKLSPEMRVIQERYRKVPALDPKRQEMQQEIAAPAGLNLYWLSSNLCSVVQQAVTMRIIASHGDRAQRKERRRQ